MDEYHFEAKREEVIRKLNELGIGVKKGKKKPVNKTYSGLVGKRKKILKFD